MMKQKVLIILVGILMFSFQVFSNNTDADGDDGIIKGKITDSKTKQPVEYATVAVYSKEDDSVVTGVITDENGEFKIKGLKPGAFYVVVSFMGYDEKRFDDLVVGNGREVLDLGDIFMGESTKSLDEVEVVANQQSIDFQIDKKVVSVGKQMTSASLSAVEVLENVPSIKVDIDGNVSLRGSTGITVLIDGKPTVLDASDALRQIPASTIENIEIITNPSAKYQPDGTGGIINIVTKKNRLQGVQGLINIKAGNFEQYGGDFLLNYRKNNFNFYVGGDYNNRPFPGESYAIRKTTSDGVTTTKISNGESDRGHEGRSIRTGLDWDITDNDALSIGFRAGKYNMDGESELTYLTITDPVSTEVREDNISKSSRNGNYYSLTGNYLKKFAQKGHELAGQLNYRYRDGGEWSKNWLYEENSTDVTSGTYTTEDGPSGRWELRLDYTKPIGNDKLEAGFQGRKSNSEDLTSLSDYNTSTGDWDLQGDKSNSIDYVRDIYALYATYKGEKARLGYQIGLRGEYTNREIKNKTDGEKYTINRWDYFPTVHLSYKLPEDNQLMGSYSRRIDRPRGWFLEPFVTWEDMYNVRMGDPNIKPEYIDALELSYLKKWGQTQLSLETYYRVTHNKVERIESVYDEGIVLTTFANVGSDYSLGADVTLSTSLAKWWDVNLMGNLYNYKVEGEMNGESYDNTSFNWSSRINNTFKVVKNLQLQLDANYNSATVTSQGRNESNYSINGAVRYDFMDRKMSLAMQARDIFSTSDWVSITETNSLYNYQRRSRKSPMISFTLSIRLNNYTQKRGNSQNSGSMDDDGI